MSALTKEGHELRANISALELYALSAVSERSSAAFGEPGVDRFFIDGLTALAQGDTARCEDVVKKLAEEQSHRHEATTALRELKLRLSFAKYDAAHKASPEEALREFIAAFKELDPDGALLEFRDEPPENPDAAYRGGGAVSEARTVLDAEACCEARFRPVSAETALSDPKAACRSWYEGAEPAAVMLLMRLYHDLLSALQSDQSAPSSQIDNFLDYMVSIYTRAGAKWKGPHLDVPVLSKAQYSDLIRASLRSGHEDALAVFLGNATLQQLEAIADDLMPAAGEQDSVRADLAEFWLCNVSRRYVGAEEQREPPSSESQPAPSLGARCLAALKMHSQHPFEKHVAYEHFGALAARLRLIYTWRQALRASKESTTNVTAALTGPLRECMHARTISEGALRDVGSKVPELASFEIWNPGLVSMLSKLLEWMVQAIVFCGVPVDFFGTPIEHRQSSHSPQPKTPIDVLLTFWTNGDLPEAPGLAQRFLKFLAAYTLLLRGGDDAAVADAARRYPELRDQALVPLQSVGRGRSEHPLQAFIRQHSPSSVKQLFGGPLLRFSKFQSQEFAGSDRARIWLEVSAELQLRAQVYVIDLEKYALEGDGAIYLKQGQLRTMNPDMPLHGMKPVAEVTPNLQPSGAGAGARGWTLACLDLEEVASINGERGCFVVDVCGGDEVCRGIIVRGALHYLRRTTAAGYAFSIFYEDHTRPREPSIRMRSKIYTAREPQGEVLLPFPETTEKVDIVLTDGAGFAQRVPVKLEAETYTLEGSIEMDKEALQTVSQADILVRTRLLLNGVRVPLELLENVTLTVETANAHGATASHVVPEFEPVELPAAAVCRHRVPERCEALNVRLTAQVTSATPGRNSKPRVQNVSLERAINVQRALSVPGIADVYLTRLWRDGASQVALQVLGRSGEPLKDVKVDVKLKHWAWKAQSAPIPLRSDEAGLVILRELPGITHVTASFSAHGSAASHEWALPTPEHSDLKQALCLEAGPDNWVTMPYCVPDSSTEGPDAEGIAMWSVTRDGKAIRKHPVEVVNNAVKVSHVPPGSYVLHLPRLRKVINITATPAPSSGDPDVTLGTVVLRRLPGRLGFRKLALDSPVRIDSLEADCRSGLKVRVEGGRGRRVLTLIFTRFVPNQRSETVGWDSARPSQDSVSDEDDHWRAPRSFLLGARQLEDEVKYVFDRRQSSARVAPGPGLMLRAPSLLVDGQEVKDVENDEDAATQAMLDYLTEPAKMFCCSSGGYGGRGALATRSAMARHFKRACSRARPAAPAYVGFVPAGCIVSNVAVPENGDVVLSREDLPALDGYSQVRVIVESQDTTFYAATAPIMHAADERRLVDVLASQQPFGPGAQFMRRQTVTPKLPGELLTVHDLSSTKVHMIDRVGDVYTALTRLLPSSESVAWDEFEALSRWTSLPRAEKIEQLVKRPCYELFFFIKHVDPDVFESAVRPSLRSRLECERDTMAHLLLDDERAVADAARDPSWLQRTSPIERLLVAAAIGNTTALQAIAMEFERDQDSSKSQSRFASVLACGELTESLANAAAPPLPPAAPGTSGPAVGAAQPHGAPRPTALAKKQAAPRRGREGFLDSVEPMSAHMIEQNGRQEAAAGSDFVLEDSEEYEDVLEDSEEYEDEGDHTHAFVEDDDGGLSARREMMALAAREPSKLQCREWLEATYFKAHDRSKHSELCPGGPFWADYARWLATPPAERGPFLSPRLHLAGATFTEAVFALAVIGGSLSQGPEEHAFRQESAGLEVAFKRPALVFMEEICAGQDSLPQSAKLAGRLEFLDPMTRTRVDPESGEEEEAFLQGPLLTSRIYHMSVLVTNLTARTQQLELVVPVPEGALPLEGGSYVNVVPVTLQAYAVAQRHYVVYFPKPGRFAVPRPTLVQKGNVVAALETGHETLEVMHELPPELQPAVDKSSAQWLLSSAASDEEVLEALARGTPPLPLSQLRWRCKRSRTFFTDLTQCCRKVMRFDPNVWAYGFMWEDARAVSDFLQHKAVNLRTELGPLQSQLLTIRDTHSLNRHAEYWPIVVPRAHELRGETAFNCEPLKQRWRHLLSTLCRVPQPTSEHLLLAAYFMCAMQRYATAQTLLQRSSAAAAGGDGGDQAATMQRDYLKAYLLLCDADPELETVLELCAAHKGGPHQDWSARWREMEAFVREVKALCSGQAAPIDEASKDEAEEPAATRKGSWLTMDDSKLAQGHMQVSCNPATTKALQVSVHPIDVELLFSVKPFQLEEGGSVGAVFTRPLPGHSVSVPVEASGEVDIDLAQLFPGAKSASSIVEVVSGMMQTDPVTWHGQHIKLEVNEEHGELRALHSNNVPCVAAYVKVFVRKQGKVKFWKDGYTSLTGRYNYASFSGNTDGLTKFAILVIDKSGASAMRVTRVPPFLQ